MDFESLIENMTPDIYQSLKRAVEIGKWPDGKLLSQEQKALCLEAIISYDSKFLSEDQRVGYIDRGKKSDGEKCDDKNIEQNRPLKWT